MRTLYLQGAFLRARSLEIGIQLDAVGSGDPGVVDVDVCGATLSLDGVVALATARTRLTRLGWRVLLTVGDEGGDGVVSVWPAGDVRRGHGTAHGPAAPTSTANDEMVARALQALVALQEADGAKR